MESSSENYQTKLLIDNEWVEGEGGQFFDTINPSTGKVICQIHKASANDVDKAAAAARKALETGEWSTWDSNKRRKLLNDFADNMMKHMPDLAKIESLDNGKPFGFACHDIMGSADILRYYAGYTDKMHGKTFPMNGPFLAYEKKVPVGVCGQIIPWNFPILMAILKLAPVLATGCTTVLKPAENTTLSALKLGEILVESGMPPGVVNILPGLGHETGKDIVNHPGIDKIAFTGSTVIGKEILRSSADTLKRVTLELGGKSPVIVMEDANID